MQKPLPFPIQLATNVVYTKSTAMRLLRALLLLLIVAMAALNLRAGLLSLSPGTVYMKDLFQDYAMSWALVQGVDPYLDIPELKILLGEQTPDTTNPHPTTHPPPVAILFLPLLVLPYPAAAAAWFGLQVACLVLAMVLLLKHSFGERWKPILFGTILFLAWSPIREEFILGQQMAVIFLLIVLAWLALRSNQQILAGGLWGVCAAAKLIFWPVIVYFILARKWKAALASLVSISALNLLAAGLLGFERVFAYYTQIAPQVNTMYRTLDRNRSLWTIGYRLFYGTGKDYYSNVQADPLVFSPGLAGIVSVALPVLVLLAMLYLAYRLREVELAFSLLLAGSVILSPIMWDFYLISLVIPILVLLLRLARADYPRGPTNLAVLVLLVLLFYDQSLGWIFTRAIEQYGGLIIPFVIAALSLLPTLCVLVLAGLIARLGLRPVSAELPAPAGLKEPSSLA